MKKILIIDDEADVRRYLAALLKKHGYETLTASDGVEGLEVARRERPDLVTLDLMMPNQSGTDFYRNLVKDKELGDLLRDVHQALNYLMIAIVAGHVGAALKHHFIDRDDILTRMAPRHSRKEQSA